MEMADNPTPSNHADTKAKIDQDIPVKRVVGSFSKILRFEELEIGHSVAAVKGNTSDAYYTRFSQYKKQNPGWNYTGRTLVEDGVTVVRFWRTA
jgi:hypothetical protein